MKKKFFQASLLQILIVMFSFLGCAVGGWRLVTEIIKKQELTTSNISSTILICVFAVLVFAISLCILISALTYNICFYDDKIYVPNQKMFKFIRVQFKEEILYSEIEKIEIQFSTKNSQNKIDIGGWTRNRPHKFFEFQLKNERKKLVHITYFTHKQLSKMIEIISEKTGLNLSYDQILKESKGTKKSRE